MKTKQLLILVLILLSSGGICLAQNYFVNTYGLDANPCKSIGCSDNCFFSVASNMALISGFLAIKTDTAGNILWSRQINIANAPYIMLNDIAQAADGGYLILAYTQISGPVYSYQTVIKLDQAGNFLWTRSYPSISSNVANSIIKNNDNGFMFVGGGCNGDNYVFKCNSNGAIVWQKAFTPLSGGDALNIATHDYNHFVVSGYIGTDLVFFEIDVSGNLYWQSLISTPNQGIITFSLKPTLDNGYVATGQILPDTIGVYQAFIIKIQPSGMLSWMKIYKVVNSESVGNDITENSDSSILMVGFASTANVKGLMVKTDNNGNLMFAKGEIYQQSYSEYNSINNYSNGRILLSGQCQNGFLPTFIAVTDNSFYSFCNITDLLLSDSVPGASSTFITHTPVDLSFQTDSLSVSVTPWALTKNVLCSSNIVPYVITGSATGITLDSATLHGRIMPAGDTLAAYFEYGTSPSYGSTITALPATVSGNYETSVSVALTSLSPNTEYHYRCLGTNGINSYYGSDSVFITPCNMTVPVITGNNSLCANSGNYTYQTQPGMTNYIWSLSPGGSITAGGTTTDNTMTVTWNTAGSQSVSVNFTNTYGCMAPTPTVYPVTVNALPSPLITGPSTVCVNLPDNVYSSQPGMINYTWAISSGGTITSGGTINDSTVTVTWNTPGTQSVSVNFTDLNKCTAPFPSNFPVLVEPLPLTAGSITGTTPVCAGTQGVSYSIADIPGASSYAWTVPTGVDIVSGQNTGSIIVNFTASASSDNFTVYGVNSCGNGPASPPFPVTVNHQASVSAGPDTSACEGTEITIHQSVAIDCTRLLWTTTGQGTIINSTSLNPSYLPSVSDTGDVTLTLMGFSSSPCRNDSSGMIIHYSMHPAVYAGPDQQACSGIPVIVTGAFTLHCSAFFWTSNGQGQLINATNLSPTYIPASGEYGTVTLTLYGSGTESCQWEDVSGQMNILINPFILIHSDKSDTIPYNTSDTLSVHISGGSGDYGYTWEPGSLLLNDTVANPITVNLVNDTLFTLLLKDKYTGCSATDSIHVHLLVPEISENCIVVHNVVTPNGDGLNDRFIIDCIENYPVNKVEIFNRWGDRVNIFTNYDNNTRSWDGTNENGKLLPDGTYYYVITIPNAKAIVGWVFVRGGSQ